MSEALVQLRSVSKQYGAEPLFEEVDLVITAHARLALIGANGSGKSTLLGMVAGTVEPDSGERHAKRDLTLELVPQSEEHPAGTTVRNVLQAAVADLNLAEHQVEARIDRLLNELSWGDGDQDAAQLSGGWGKRLTIGKRLLRQSDVLLLDEPTNHLDLAGVWWLEDCLRRYPGAVVIVSHDRWFLQMVATSVAELGYHFPSGIFTAAGNYEQFCQHRDDFLREQAELRASLANKMRRENEWLSRQPKARGTKAVSRIRAAEELRQQLSQVHARVNAQREADFALRASNRRTQDLIVATNVSKRYGDNLLFSQLDYRLSPGTRLGLVGLNGSGKSTLMKILGGMLPADSGSVKMARELVVQHFEQDRSNLEPDKTLRSTWCPAGGDTVMYHDRGIHCSAWAQRFLFSPQQLDQPVGSLSGGEQARLLISLLMLKPADVLLLDEPTNDLDIPALEVLESNLYDYPGAMVLITHDRYLLDRVSNQLLALDGKGGTFAVADYRQWEQLQQRQQQPAEEPATTETTPVPAAQDWQTQKELKSLERRLEKYENELHAISERMSDPKIASDATALEKLGQDAANKQAQIDELYERWGELET